MMKKMFLGAAFALMLVMPANAQRNQNAQKMSPEEAIEMKTNRMAKRLMLDDATTAKFAPIYKEYLTGSFEEVIYQSRDDRCGY